MGKVRARAQASQSASKDELVELASKAAAKYLAGKEVIKTVVVPGRLVNFVVK
jgi:leucyl-tRNA synthetase